MTKEQEILAAAEDEFYHNGYLATSMVTVAKRAGVTHAMVNYYYRSKEQLFLKILDTHIYQFIENLRPIMKEDGDFLDTLVDAVGTVFDTLNADRMFPSLILDVVRTAPELLERYRTSVEDFSTDAIRRHSARLEKEIKAGRILNTTIREMLDNILLLTASPFLMIPTLEKVCRFGQNEIDDYLARRKKEIAVIIRTRYSIR